MRKYRAIIEYTSDDFVDDSDKHVSEEEERKRIQGYCREGFIQLSLSDFHLVEEEDSEG